MPGAKFAGQASYIQNAGFVWVPILIILGIAGFFGMNNIVTEEVSPNYGNTIGACLKISMMLIVGLLTSVFGLWLLLYVGVTKWVVLPVVIFLTTFILKQIPGPTKKILARTYKIFGNKQTWVMTVIYTMTFGSFIGYSAAVPLAIKVVFGYVHDPVTGANLSLNPNSPTVFTWAWMGPFIGALIRPVGGWISDKVGGAIVTQWVSILMIFSALGVAYYMRAAYHSASPEDFFPQFMVLIIILFALTGIGNGSTFQSTSVMFNVEQAGPVLAWTSAVAAYGAFLIPKILGEQTKAGTPEYALVGFAIFYFICLILNWWYYTRRGSLIKC
jgi:NNP family nitrate/nitrite transporter-like MFS transporter